MRCFRLVPSSGHLFIYLISSILIMYVTSPIILS
nr:MAG TPA: hypothetical protein [Bacteriophage sp.]